MMKRIDPIDALSVVDELGKIKKTHDLMDFIKSDKAMLDAENKSLVIRCLDYLLDIHHQVLRERIRWLKGTIA